MAQTYESRQGQVSYPAKTVYDFLSDFSHFQHLIPEEQLSNWETDGDRCSFEIPGIGRIGLHMTEKKPVELIRIAGDSSAGINFNLLIHIEEIADGQSRVKLVMETDLNVFVRAVAEKPLKQFLEILISHIETFDFDRGQPDNNE